MPSPLNVPITPPRVAFIDPRTGTVSREWYMFFLSLFTNTATSDLLLKGPAVQDTSGEFANAIQTAQLAAQLGATQAEVADLQTAVQGLALAPPPLPLKRTRYGQFYDTTTQVAAAINTATAITFNTTDLSKGVTIGSPTSRVVVDSEGVYNFQTSIQLDSTVATAEEFYLWFRVNGVDVTNSASQARVQGNNAEVFLAVNLFLNLKAGDYVELMFSVSSTGVQLLASGAVAPHPGIPSIILTVSDNL